MISKTYYTYILTNKYNRVLYIGVTNNLIRRVYEHKKQYHKGFTQRYNVNKLIYYELFDKPLEAIKREKTLKNLLRSKKEAIVNEFNREWRDLYEDI